MAARLLGIIVSIPLLFLVPGYVLFRSRLFNSSKVGSTEKFLLVVGLSVSMASLIALTLAELGHLSLWLLDIMILAASVLARLLFGGSARRVFSPRVFRWEIAAAAALVLVALLFFMPPGEYITGDADPGYYYNNGYHIGQTGSVDIHDDTIPGLSDFEVDTSYQRGVVQFTAFHLRDRETGRIQPLLYHLLPLWTGLFIMLFGKMGGLFVTPVFAVLGVLAVYALGLKLSRSVAGAVAGGLLATLFFPQVWYSRLPSSEVFSQLFIIGSILFFVDFLTRDDRLSAAASALLFTAAATARPEALFLALPMLLIMVIEILRNRYTRSCRLFANLSLLGLVYVWFYIRFVQYHYFHTNIRKVLDALSSSAGMSYFLALFAVSIGLALVFFNLKSLHQFLARTAWRITRHFEGREALISSLCRLAIGLLSFAAFAYFYFMAPEGTQAVNAPQRFFYNTSVFFGGVAVFVFVAALSYMIYELDIRVSFLVFASCMLYLVAFSESQVTSGYLPWLSRRFLTVVVPLMMIGMGYVVGRLWKTGKAVLRTAGAALVTGFFVLFVVFASPVFWHQEYEGSNRQIAELAEELDDYVVLLPGSYDAEVLGVPLRYQFGIDARRVWTLEDAEGFREMVEKYRERGRRVLIEGSGSVVDDFNTEILELLSFEKAFSFECSFPRLRKSYTARPCSIGDQKHELNFFFLDPKG